MTEQDERTVQQTTKDDFDHGMEMLARVFLVGGLVFLALVVVAAWKFNGGGW